MLRRPLTVLAALALVAALLAATSPVPASAQSRFSDGDATVHTEAIEALAQTGVVSGYGDGTYRPRQAVSRDQMATFLKRALQLRDRSHSFDDVHPDSTHSGAIGAISRVSPPITEGCARDLYCPHQDVTRAQMATFLKRALSLPDDTGQSFADVDPDSVHAPGIRAVAAAGITLGCGDGTRYCPAEAVRRDQMAAFLDRALGLEGPVPCPDASGTSRPEVLGAAVPPRDGYLTTAAVRAGGALEMLSNDQPTSRSARVRGAEITATATIPGERTWAHEVIGDDVYVGQWNVPSGRDTLYRFPATDGDVDRAAVGVADLPTGGEFWNLTADDGGRLYAATRAHADAAFRDQIGLGEDEHVVHRVDPGASRANRVEHLTFEIPGGPPRDADGQRPDPKQLAWHADTLFVGLGQQREGARLYALTDLDAADGPQVEDITPENLAPARAVYSMEVTDDLVVLGTQISDGEGARVIILDRQDTSTVLTDVTLQADGRTEDRVDQVHVDGDRVLAATFPSGAVHEVTLGDGTVLDQGSSRQLGTPVDNTPTRFLERTDKGIQGVSGTGLIWTIDERGDLVDDPVDIAALPGAPLAPGRAHSLALTARHIVSGASSVVHLRSRSETTQNESVGIGGEAKALAYGNGRLFAATYPNGELWEIDERTYEAEIFGNWTNDFNRPRDATFHRWRDRDEVLVVARDDDTGAGGLVVVPAASAATRIRDHRGEPVEALSVTAHEDRAFVGTRNGAVRAVDLDTRRESWVSRPAGARVVSLEMFDGRIVGIAQTNSSGNGRTWFELDPRNGALIRSGRSDVELGRGDSGDGTVLGPVSVVAKGRAVAAIQRGDDRATTLYEHAPSGTFGGPFIAAAGDCGIHVIADRNLVRLPYDPRTRLDR